MVHLGLQAARRPARTDVQVRGAALVAFSPPLPCFPPNLTTLPPPPPLSFPSPLCTENFRGKLKGPFNEEDRGLAVRCHTPSSFFSPVSFLTTADSFSFGVCLGGFEGMTPDFYEDLEGFGASQFPKKDSKGRAEGEIHPRLT